MADITGERGMTPERNMISEKVAPTLVGRVLSSFDLVVIFVALVLFCLLYTSPSPRDRG